MKIIFTHLFDRGFCFNPFIVLPVQVKGKSSYLKHEKVHFSRQPFFPVFWVLKYFLSKRFRLQEELLAYEAQIKEEIKNGEEVIPDIYATILSQQYWGMISYEDALLEVTMIVVDAKV